MPEQERNIIRGIIISVWQIAAHLCGMKAWRRRMQRRTRENGIIAKRKRNAASGEEAKNSRAGMAAAWRQIMAASMFMA